jgi:hypothetical protein
MPPKKQKKLRKPRANKRSGKPQPLPRSVQALLQYLGGSDVKLGSSRPQRAQVAQQPQPQQLQQQQPQQLQQQQIQYAAAPKAAPKAAARPRGRPPKGTGNVIGQSPLIALAPPPQQIIMQQPISAAAQQQQDTLQADVAAIKVKQEAALLKSAKEASTRQTPTETLAFFQQKAEFPIFMGQFPTRSEYSAAAKQPSLTGTLFTAIESQPSLAGSIATSAEPNTPSKTAPSRQPTGKRQKHITPDRLSDYQVQINKSDVTHLLTPSIPSSRWSESSRISMHSARYEGMAHVKASSSQASSVIISGGGGSARDMRAPAASSVGDHLAQEFIKNVSSPEQLATKKLRGRQPKAAAAAVPMKFEGQTAEQAISTFQAAKPARKPRAKASAAVVLPQNVDPSTQVQMLAAGGAAAAAPKQRRGRSLTELAKGAGAKSE